MASLNLYPEDRTGTLAFNKVSEVQVITPINNRNFHFFVPKFAPFYEDGFKIYQNINNTQLELILYEDFYFCYKYESASLSTGKNVWGGIGFLNLSFTGEVTLSYQTVGGNWVLSDVDILEIVANEVYNPRGRTWDQTVNKPVTFGPTTHIQDASDFLTQEEVGEKLDDIADAILANANRPIPRPPVTLEDLGIPKIGNWGMATVPQAIDGNSADTIISPLTLRAVLSHYNLLETSKDIKDFRDHINNKNNPHETDKGSVDLGKVENRGVAPLEQVLGNRDDEGLISLTLLKAYLRTHGCLTAPEDEPKYPEKGAVLSYRCTSNYDRIGLFADGMGHTYEKIVEANSVGCGYRPPEKNNYPPHGTILQYYCLDFERWKIVADGYGGSYHAFVMANSNDCGYNGPGGTTTFAPAGTLLSAHCDKTTLVQTLANGAGGSYENRLHGHADCANNTTYAPRGTLVSTFCENKNEMGKYTDGSGGFYNEVLVQNSTKCGYIQPSTGQPTTHPPRGTPMGNECRGYNLVNKFADGNGGIYTEITEANSPKCGYVSVQPTCKPRGTFISEKCEGTNYVRVMHDGNCGTYQETIEVNSTRCGGGQTPQPTSQPTNPPTSRPTDPPRNLAVTYSSDRSFISPSTYEVQTVHITGGASNSTYFITLWNRVEGGTTAVGYHAQLSTDSNGQVKHILPIQNTANAQLTPDGVYSCWAEVRTIQSSASPVATSNSITRSFSGFGHNNGRRNIAFGVYNGNMTPSVAPWWTAVFTGFNPGENLNWEMVFKPASGYKQAVVYNGYVRANNNGIALLEYTPSDQGIAGGNIGPSSIFPDGGYVVFMRVGNSVSNSNNFSSYTGSSLQFSNSRFA